MAKFLLAFFVCVLSLIITPLSLSLSLSYPTSTNPSLPLDLVNKGTLKGIHEILPKYNLPLGLLPGNVKGYTLEPDNTLTVELTHQCYVIVADRKIFYDTHIKGKLGYGKIDDLSGIQAKKLRLWMSVSSIEVDEKTNLIEFHVGPFTVKISVRDFQTIPSCREKEIKVSSESDSASASI